jgi:hypothetical protein
MVKSIVKPNRVKAMFTPHSAIPKDGYHNMNMFHQISVPNHLGHNVDQPITHYKAWITHYITRSKQEFDQKIRRGIACGPSPDWRRNIWTAVERAATVYDDRMTRYLPKLKENLKGTSVNKTFNDIQGFFNYEAVYDHAVSIAKHNSKFVEVGTWLGKSAIYLANLIKQSNKNIQFYTVDTCTGVPNDSIKLEQDHSVNFKPTIDSEGGNTARLLIQNIYDCGVQDFVIPIITNSVKASRMFEDGSLDFVFIDASHNYFEVKKDLHCWWPKIKVGGLLMGHDYDNNFPEVVRAVNEFFNKNNYDAQMIQNNTWGMIK